MASGGSSMNNKKTRNLLQLLNGVNFPSFDENIQEEVNVEQVKREYLLGRMITDILEGETNPKVKKHKLEELNGKNSSQLWRMIKWAKRWNMELVRKNMMQYTRSTVESYNQ